jgi:predicted nuclease of predicted toxin-antitoxin system
MISFYFDEHMSRPVAHGLIRRGYEVIMAIDVDMTEKDDDTEHLPFAKERGLVMVTFDRPFAGRTMQRIDHSGLICLSETIRDDIGRIITVLAEFADQHTPEQTAGHVFWLK